MRPGPSKDALLGAFLVSNELDCYISGMAASVRPAFTAEELTHIFNEVPAVVWACDRDLRFTFSAGSALAKLGLQPHQVVGMTLADYFGDGADGGRMMAQIRRALAGEAFVYEARWAGTIFESHVAPLRSPAGGINGLIGIALDVTERLAAEEELLLSRVRLEHTSALFPVTHYVMDASERIELTPEHRQMLGLPDDTASITYGQILDHMHPDDRMEAIEARRLAKLSREPYRTQFRFIRPDGTLRYLRVHASWVFDAQGNPVRTVGTVTDVTSDAEHAEQIALLLRHDGVTGLPNRVYFAERLRHDLAFAAGTSEIVGLVVFDLDRFSRINDTLGHLAGDEYLRTIASRLRALQEGTSDQIARLGGDDFAMLLRGAQRRGEIVRRIEELRGHIEEPVEIGEHRLQVSVSMGVAIAPYDAPDETLLQKADLALSQARAAGAGRTEYYDLLTAQHVASTVRLEHGLSAAIREGRLTAYYQPIVAGDARLNAVEALVRWKHPDYGLLGPTAFLEIAEETGLIAAMDEQIIRRACRDLAEMRAVHPALRLNVNLSSRHLLSRRLTEFVAAILEENALPPQALQLEVTEQSLIEDVSAGRRAIESLRALGVSVVIDDFGTGYNTLGYLKSFQVDGIKLDRFFVKDITTDRYSRAVCAGVMAMASSLELPVIAEGIETSEQRDAVLALGCTELQGFLYGRPAPASDFLHTHP